MPKLTQARRDQYRRLFADAEMRAQRAKEVDRWCDRVMALQARYLAIGTPIDIPWHFIAAVHMRESSLRLNRHLHNGDPLSARTVRVPAGRPKLGAPPFTFDASAADALVYKGLDQWRDWSLPGTLFKLEAYNGWGYDVRGLNSPYLWSFSHHYVKGKFVKDSVYDAAAVDQQCGTATLLRRLAERQEIQFDAEPALEGAPQVVSYALKRPRDSETIARTCALQHWLNTFPGIYLKVDGWPGPRTSTAFKAVTGKYLVGDLRR